MYELDRYNASKWPSGLRLHANMSETRSFLDQLRGMELNLMLDAHAWTIHYAQDTRWRILFMYDFESQGQIELSMEMERVEFKHSYTPLGMAFFRKYSVTLNLLMIVLSVLYQV